MEGKPVLAQNKGIFTCFHCGQQHMRYVEKCPTTGDPLPPSYRFEGELIGDRYRLRSIIGEGGMGIVYEGLHEKLGSRVAVKFLRTDLNLSKETISRFENEAKIAAALGHRNIVRIFDMGSFESVPYFVMEFLDGVPLDEIIEDKGTLGVPQAVDIVIQILEALNAVHFKGVIHRDLKPENVIIVNEPGGGEIVKILDFGICRLQTDACSAMRMTKTGAVFGTPYYMSPEQAEGRRDIDSRADLYSVGAILYKMLTGRTPFVGENYNTVIVNIINKEPPLPRKYNMEIPRDLETVIVKSLERNRDKRFLDAREFIEALEPHASFALRRERRSSLSAQEERKEPVPGDIWDGEISVIVHDESSAQTLRAELQAKEASAGKEKEEALERAVTLPKKKKTFSWDSTAGQSKSAAPRREIVWLLPAGIALSLLGAVLIIGVIVTLMNVNRIAGGMPGQPASKGTGVAVTPKGDGAAVVTQVEESSIEMAGPPTAYISFTGLPQGAAVYVDGFEVEKIPVPVKAKDETYQVLVEADGYESYMEHVQVRADTVVQVNMQPSAKKGKKKFHKAIDSTTPTIDTQYPGKKAVP
jgi:serine/threonine protein kinase